MKRKGLLKRMMFVLAGLILIAIAGVIIIDKVVRNRVIQKLHELEPELRLSWTSIHTDIFRSRLSIENLTVQFHPLLKSTHQHEVSIRHVVITGINFFKAASAKNLQVNTIRLDSSEIRLDKYLLENKQDSTLKMPFEKISARHVEISKAHLLVHTQKTKELGFEGGLVINNAEISDQLNFAAVKGEFNNFSCIVARARHTLHIKNISVDSKTALCKLKAITLTPFYDKYEFAKKLGRQADHIRASVSAITIEQPDIPKLLEKKFVAEKISVAGCKANIFRDRRLPRKLTRQELPAEFFESIPFDIHVNNCAVTNASVVYEEYPDQGNESGLLRIEKLNTTITPLVNHPGKNDPDHLTMFVKGSIMGSGTVEGSIYMPLNAKKQYYIRGVIRNLDLPHLNSSAENLGMFHIKSGMLDMLEFRFSMNEKKAEGKIVGEYHNLVIQKLEYNKKGEKNVAHLRSFVLRHVIIPKNKDRSLPEKKRTGKVDYTRDPTRFVSNYLLQSLLTGIKSSFTLGFLLPK